MYGQWEYTTHTGIPAQCYTNLDEYKQEEWPRMFPQAPRIGDRVEAKSRKQLYVCGVVWMCDGSIAVELHKATLL
jgi:hypothetical protein